MEQKLKKLSWRDVEDLGKTLPRQNGLSLGAAPRVYGVPRGGAIVARMFYPLAQLVDNPQAADIIVDDIIDSGKTKQRFHEMNPNAIFCALVDKTLNLPVEFAGKWIAFPWEEEGTKDLHDTVIRQLQFIGEDATREGLKDTPRRVIKALGELTSGYAADPKKILTSALFEEKFDEMVIVKHIPFWSLCEHHMLPFHGTCSVAYIPNGKIVGLSKIPRVVEAFSRRLQVQERLTQEIAHCISESLGAQDVGVHVEGYHTCMAMRGVRSAGNMVTNCLLGQFKNSQATRDEFLSEIGRK